MFYRCIDIGGNGVRRSDVDPNNQKIENLKERKVNSLPELKQFATENINSNVISIASAGLILNNKIIAKSPNIPWLNNTNMPELFTNFKTFVFNDMETSVIGMNAIMDEIKNSLFLGITISSGIGAKIVNNGKILFPEAEIGHIKVFDNITCPCGNKGCAEAQLGGEAIKQTIIQTCKTLKLSCNTLKLNIPENTHPCQYFKDEYANNKTWAKSLFSSLCSNYADLFNVIQTMTQIKKYVFKGTFAKSFMPLMEQEIKANMKANLINKDWSNIEFLYSKNINDVNNSDSFMGAAILAEVLLEEKI